MNRMIIVAGIFFVTASVNAQTPLYSAYAAQIGSGVWLSTTVFAAYLLGVLPVIVFLGGVSEYWGKRNIFLIGMTASFSANFLLVLFPSFQVLLLSRILEGVGVGLTLGTGTAYLSEYRGSSKSSNQSVRWVALSSAFGFGSGPVMTAGSLYLHDSIIPYSYVVLLIGIGICMGFLVTLPNDRTSRKRPSLLQVFHTFKAPFVPSGSLIACWSICTAWAVAGVVIAIVPIRLETVGLKGFAPFCIFLVTATGAVIQPFIYRFRYEHAVQAGCALLVLGYTILLAGMKIESPLLLMLGSTISGAAAYGFIYSAGVGRVSKTSGDHKARAVSGFLIWAYLGLCLPSFGLGYLIDLAGASVGLVGFGVVLTVACIILSSRVIRQGNEKVIYPERSL
ncbi:MFS transporter [Paenibacillus sp. SI8]|uniref:MFS transporter n=1 Tax=unclassified Paenibacillus TaxID=185978 RepID=UPI0034656E91